MLPVRLHSFPNLPARPAAATSTARKRWQLIAGQNGNLFAELMETAKTCSLGQETPTLRTAVEDDFGLAGLDTELI